MLKGEVAQRSRKSSSVDLRRGVPEWLVFLSLGLGHFKHLLWVLGNHPPSLSDLAGFMVPGNYFRLGHFVIL